MFSASKMVGGESVGRLFARPASRHAQQIAFNARSGFPALVEAKSIKISDKADNAGLTMVTRGTGMKGLQTPHPLLLG
jgi:hypothetical protein